MPNEGEGGGGFPEDIDTVCLDFAPVGRGQPLSESQKCGVQLRIFMQKHLQP